MRAGGRVAEQLHELLFDVGRDRVLPAVGFAMDLLPLQADDVDEESLRQAVPANDRDREASAALGEPQRAVVEELGVALVDEPVHLLGDRSGREAEPLDEAGPDRA